MDPHPILSRARVVAARAFAVNALADPRASVDHLDATVAILLRFHPDAEESAVCAAFLHEVLEGTRTTEEALRAAFAFRVTELVLALTAVPGETRKAGNRATWAKTAQIEGAVRLMLACRIASVETCWAERDRKLFMYKGEYLDFRGALWSGDGGAERPMWEHLDRLMGWG